MTNPARRLCRGFTLVELLVVIGIIALLISILLPALSGARRAAVKVQCLNNFRQLGNAIIMYAGSYHQTLPGPATKGQKAYYGSDATRVNYLATLLAPYLNLPQPSATVPQLNKMFLCPAFPYDATLGDTYQMIIQQTYVPRSQQDPAQPDIYSTDVVTDPACRYKYPFGIAVTTGIPTPVNPLKITQMENPTEVVLLREIDKLNTTTNTTTGLPKSGSSWSSGWKLMALPMHGRIGKVSTRNKLFLDGHAMSVQETP